MIFCREATKLQTLFCIELSRLLLREHTDRVKHKISFRISNEVSSVIDRALSINPGSYQDSLTV